MKLDCINCSNHLDHSRNNKMYNHRLPCYYYSNITELSYTMTNNSASAPKNFIFNYRNVKSDVVD